MVGDEQSEALEYVGFWRRVGATIIDTILLMFITTPLLLIFYGTEYFFMPGMIQGLADFLISYLLPAIVVIAFWVTAGATPGKMALSARVVDATTGEPMTLGQASIRYLGYFVSIIPLFVGVIWVAFDSRKQGWHDKIAGTVVIRPRAVDPLPVHFTTRVEGGRKEPRL